MRRPFGAQCAGKAATGASFCAAQALRLAAVAAVLGREHELVLVIVEVAERPAVVAALLEQHELLGGQRRLLLGLVEAGEVLVQLVPPVLGGVDQVPARVRGDALAVTDAGRVAILRREGLVELVRVVAPDAAARLQLGARLDAGRLGDAVLLLAGVGGGGDVDVQHPVGVDREGVHRVITTERQARDHDLGRGGRDDGVRREGVLHDPVLRLDVQRVLVEHDPGATRAAVGRTRAEALDDVRLAAAGRVAERDEEAARVRGTVAVVAAAPGVEVDDAVRGDGDMARVPEIVGEHRRAEAGRELEPRVPSRTGGRGGRQGARAA